MGVVKILSLHGSCGLAIGYIVLILLNLLCRLFHLSMSDRRYKFSASTKAY